MLFIKIANIWHQIRTKAVQLHFGKGPIPISGVNSGFGTMSCRQLIV